MLRLSLCASGSILCSIVLLSVGAPVLAAPLIKLVPQPSGANSATTCNVNITGTQATVSGGGCDLELRVLASGWGSAPGSPDLRTMQARILSSGYLGANASPPASGMNLNPKGYALPDPSGGNRDLGAFVVREVCSISGRRCGTGLPPCSGGEGTCVPNPAYAFACCPNIGIADVSTINYRWGAVRTDFSGGVNDTGQSAYLGTLILTVPAPASTITYTLNLNPGADETFMLDENDFTIPGLQLSPATIVISVCTTNAQCGDGTACNGQETCVAGACQPGVSTCSGSTPFCDPSSDQCVACLLNAHCLDSIFCDGQEVCTSGTCQNGANPCTAPTPLCNETTDTCYGCTNNAQCSDGLFCNGTETCHPTTQVCLSGSPPCTGGQICNEASDQCGPAGPTFVLAPQPAGTNSATTCNVAISGTQATVYNGGCDLELRLFASGWGSAPGSPDLRLLQARILGSGYLGANASPPASGTNLNPKGYALPDPDGGMRDFGAFVVTDTCSISGRRCGPGFPPCAGGEGSCFPNPSYAFACCPNLGIVDNSTIDYRWAALRIDVSGGVPDTGQSAYFGTLILTIPALASTTTYTLNIDPDSGQSFMNDENDMIIPGLQLPATTVVITTCSNNGQCSDGIACNGAETCVAGVCQDGASPCSGATPFCDLNSGQCVACLLNAHCLDSIFCDGQEVCTMGTCQNGAFPCTFPTPLCNENLQSCVGCLNNAQCSDGLFCTGVEICDPQTQACQSGSPPCTGGEICIESSDQCGPAGPPTLSLYPQPRGPRSQTTCVGPINGEQMTAYGGQCDVEYRIRVRGWGGAPGIPSLHVVQAGMEGSSYLGVAATPAFPGENLIPVGYVPPDPAGGSRADGAYILSKSCYNSGRLCSSGQPPCTFEEGSCVDNPDFVFECCPTITAVDVSTIHYRFGMVPTGSESVFDSGIEHYVGTLVMHIPFVPTAARVHTIAFRASESFLLDDSQGPSTEIPGLVLASARLTVTPCTGDGECDDGLFCNGLETCDELIGACIAGVAPCAAGDFCDESLDQCFGDVPVPVSAAAPDDVPKNRYFSFTPPAWGTPTAIKVTRIAPGPAVEVGWVFEPDGQDIAGLSATPAVQTWSGSVIHVGDCAVIPGATYEVRSTPDIITYSPPFTVSTAAPPLDKFWGDTVGTLESGAWTPPNGFMNVNDITAALQYIQALPSAPPLTWVDVQSVSSGNPCLNRLVNTSDVFMLVKAFQADAYPFTTDPATCPPCP